MKKTFNSQNIFLLLLVMMVVCGKYIPYREEYNSIFNLEKFINWGIAGIFFLYGLKLNLKEVVHNISNWKLHLIVQFGTFVLFPSFVLIFYPFTKDSPFFITWLTIYFLASLPSTVSSSVVMVSIAKGNITSAIFNASISGLIGIVITPLLMSFFMTEDHASGAIHSEIAFQLLLKVLLPIVLGLLLNTVFKNVVRKYNKWIGKFDRFIILLIIYENFSKASTKNIFASVSITMFMIIAFSCVALFFVMYGILKLISKKLNFNRQDIITTTFCGSKKSLIHGSLFVMVLEISENQKVLFLLPIMLYHSFQLFYVSWLANRISKEVE